MAPSSLVSRFQEMHNSGRPLKAEMVEVEGSRDGRENGQDDDKKDKNKQKKRRKTSRHQGVDSRLRRRLHNTRQFEARRDEDRKME